MRARVKVLAPLSVQEPRPALVSPTVPVLLLAMPLLHVFASVLKPPSVKVRAVGVVARVWAPDQVSAQVPLLNTPPVAAMLALSPIWNPLSVLLVPPV